MKLSRYERETIINFNAEEPTATLYTRDPTVMRKLDQLVISFPEVYKCIGVTDIDIRPMKCLNLLLIIVSRDGYQRSRDRRRVNGQIICIIRVISQ